MVVELLQRRGIAVARVPTERRILATTLGSRGFGAWLLACVKRRFAVQAARHVRRTGIAHPDYFFGVSHAGRISQSVLAAAFHALPPGALIEVGIHPGDARHPHDPPAS